MKFLSIVAAGALALTASAWEARAAAPATPTTPGQTALAGPEVEVEIPFAPPIGQPLHYRYETVTESRRETGSTRRTGWSDLSFLFERHGDDGYRLTVTTLRSGGSGLPEAFQAASDQIAEAMRALPLVVLVSADGEIGEIENEEHYWNKTIGTLHQKLSTAAESPESRQVLEAMLRTMHEWTPEGRRSALLGELDYVLNWVGATMIVGEELEGEAETPGFFGGTIPVQLRISLQDVVGDHATIGVVGDIDAESMLAMATEFASRMIVHAGRERPSDEELRAEVAAQAEGFVFEEQAKWRVSLVTGLATEIESRKTAGNRERVSVETLRIVRTN